MEIIAKSKDIRALLEKSPHLKDDDKKLIATIWWHELRELGIDPEPFRRLLDLFVDGSLSNPESIRRTRQKLQQEYPGLRGEIYKKRHQHQEQVKEELRSI